MHSLVKKIDMIKSKIDKNDNQNEQYNEIISDMFYVIDELAKNVLALNTNFDEINDYVTVLDENLGNIEEELYGFEEEESEFEDFEYTDVECKNCSEQIAVEKSLINSKSSFECPNCHNIIKF